MRKLKTKHNPVKKHKNSWVKSVTILGIVAFGISSIILLSNLNNNSSQENVKGAKTSLVASSVTGFPQQYGEFVQDVAHYNGNKRNGNIGSIQSQFGKVRIDGMAPYVIPAGAFGTSVDTTDTFVSPARIWVQAPGASYKVTWHWLNFFCPDPNNLHVGQNGHRDCVLPNAKGTDIPNDQTGIATIAYPSSPNVLGTIGMRSEPGTNPPQYCGFYQSDFFITDINGDSNLVYGDLPVSTVTPAPTGYSIFNFGTTLLATTYNTGIPCSPAALTQAAGTPAPIPTATETPIPTDTPIPTVTGTPTPLPTSTTMPIQPTDTPMPTATIMPVPTVAPMGGGLFINFLNSIKGLFGIGVK